MLRNGPGSRARGGDGGKGVVYGRKLIAGRDEADPEGSEEGLSRGTV